jgi:hypothetical protein
MGTVYQAADDVPDGLRIPDGLVSGTGPDDMPAAGS